MKKILLFLSSSILAFTPALGSNLFPVQKKLTGRVKPVVPNAKGIKVDNAAETPLPTKQKVYVYVDGEWLLESTVTITYNDQRLVATETTEDDFGELTRIVYSYDESGNRTAVLNQYSEDGGETWIDSDKTLYAYSDPVVKDFMTARTQYVYDGITWTQVYGHRYDIERNDADKVTDVSLMSYFQGNYDRIEGIELEYGNNAEYPTQWTHLAYDYEASDVKPETILYDIVWENCDNQIFTFSPTSFFVGDNRISEAMILDCEYEETAKMTVSYTNARDFEAVIIPSEQTDERHTHTLTDTDSYGSFVEELTDWYKESGVAFSEGEKYVVKYDEHFNQIGEESYMTMSISSDDINETIEELMGGMTCDYEYGENNEVLSMVNSEIYVDEETGETITEPAIKIVNEGFTTSGVDRNMLDGSEIVSRKWYDLQGRQVTKPTTGGVYIMTIEYSNGKTVSKKVVAND